MAGCVNRVILLGSVGRYGVTLKYAPSGTPCASFSLVCTEQAHDGKYFSTLIPCEIWGKRAEASSEIEAGALCLIEGKLAKRKKGEAWALVVSSFDVTPITSAPLAEVAS
jgi:single-stranded DNA-binding protein